MLGSSRMNYKDYENIYIRYQVIMKVPQCSRNLKYLYLDGMIFQKYGQEDGQNIMT